MAQRTQAVATVKIDEPYVRVTEWRFAPDAETGWHVHAHDYVVVPMLDGALLLEEPGGGTRTVPLRAHAPYTRRAGVEHNVVNVSGHDYAFMEIELLGLTRTAAMLKDFSWQAASAGLLAAVVGFASSFAVILRGLAAVGASEQQAASGLMAAAIAMGVGGVILSLRSRQPISVAWSTPGAALLASTGAVAGGFGAAVGAFVVANALIVVAGLWRPLGRAVAAIPRPLANALLAGVLLDLCLAPVRAVAAMPALALPVVLAWVVMARVKRVYAVPAAVLVAVVLIAASSHWTGGGHALWPTPVLPVPHLTVAAVLGVALPLFIVTMASQNIPGIAVLHANGYHPAPGPLFRTTGLLGVAGAPFGSPAVNLAAITAAMCTGPDAHPDEQRRYWAATIAGVTYIAFGLLAGVVTAAASASPPLLVEAVAGLALLGALGSALMGALSDPASREAAVICFLVTGSGLTFLGIGGAAWGLLAGAGVMALGRWRGLGWARMQGRRG